MKIKTTKMTTIDLLNYTVNELDDLKVQSEYTTDRINQLSTILKNKDFKTIKLQLDIREFKKP